MENVIRSYGLGKFDTMLDAALYAASLNGGAYDEASDDCGEWCGLMLGCGEWLRNTGQASELNAAELAFADAHPFAVMAEGSQGFVGVEWFETESAARARFDEYAASLTPEDEAVQ
jgi:hypothetical protein